MFLVNDRVLGRHCRRILPSSFSFRESMFFPRTFLFSLVFATVRLSVSTGAMSDLLFHPLADWLILPCLMIIATPLFRSASCSDGIAPVALSSTPHFPWSSPSVLTATPSFLPAFSLPQLSIPRAGAPSAYFA